jgi:endonuclease/exonuclease/phosphatase family metal-dependent hydrolase
LYIPIVHAPTEDKTDDMKDSFYEELERVFDRFPKYHMKILLGDFNAKVGREDIFTSKIRHESLHEISNDNGVRLVHFATSENLRVKSTMFPHRNVHKYTLTSPDEKTHNQIDHILVDNVVFYILECGRWTESKNTPILTRFDSQSSP